MIYKTIEELTTVVTGGTPSTSKAEYWENGNIPWLPSGCCQNCDVNQADKFISQSGYDNSSTQVMPVNTVMIALTGATAGKVGYLNIEACGNQSITGIFPCEELNPRFLFYFLISQRRKILVDCIGGAQAHISQGYVKKIKVPVYSKSIQERIVNIMNICSKNIKHYEMILKEYDELVKARFIEMFGTLHNNENCFDIVTIEKVCSLIKDGTHQTPEYTEDRDNGFKFLSSKDVMSQKIDWSSIKYIPAELHEKLYVTIKPQRNDVLMSKNGVNYGVAAVNDTDEVFDIYVSLALLRPKKIIDPVFLWCVINNPETKRQFDSSIKGIGVPNLHLGEIKKTKIFLPPMELQKEFTQFVRQVDKSREEVKKSLEKTKQLYDSLMQEYFG